MATKMFVHYNGTVNEFKQLSNIADYNNKIVFIKGGENGKGAAVYTHGSYFANFEEFLAAVNYVKGVNVNGTNYNAAAGGGYVAFGASDPATVAVNAGQNGITIGLTEAFINRVNNTASNLGSSADAANAEGTAFARIAQLASLVAGLQGAGSGSVADQINAAINALKGTIADGDAATLEAINDELDAIDAKWADYVTRAELVNEVSDNDGVLVNVTVKTKDGKVSDVVVNEEQLQGALNLKANAADVYDKTAAESMAQGKVDALANGAVKNNADAIATLNGNSSVAGSVDKKIVDAIDAFAAKVSDNGTIDTLKELVDYVAGVDGSDKLASAIAQIADNKGKIETLNGNAETAGSVAKAIADEVARAEAAYAVKGTEGVASGAASRAEEAYNLADSKATAAQAKEQAVAAIAEIAEASVSDSDNAYVKATIKSAAGSVTSVEIDDAGVKTYTDAQVSAAVGAYKADGVDASGLRKEIEERDAAVMLYADSLFAWEEL